jgi:trk system potassium uptake protein TrkH
VNIRAVGWLLGCVLLLLAGFMLVPAVVSAWFREQAAFEGCIGSALVTAIAGGFFTVTCRDATITEEGRVDYFRREGLAAVGLSWMLAALAGSMPFLFSGVMTSPVDAFFESASGFTTTGATILTPDAIDGLPRGIAFWRSFTHWLGGIGIVLVFVLLFPAGGRSLFRSEVPGISREAVQQRVRDSALGLVRIYVVLTLVEVLALWIVQRDLFDAFIHAFGTLATGGFSSHSSSVLYYSSWKVELILVVFMFAAGINFAVYDIFLRQGLRGAWRAACGSSEIRAYAGLIVGSTLLIAVILWFWGGSNGNPESDLPNYTSLTKSLRDSLFTVVSVQTSTGFGTEDFNRWPDVCRILLMVLAICGACAGSTGGGMKVVRFLILAKAALQGVRNFARPRAIHSVRLDGGSLPDGTVGMVMSYCGLWFLVFIVGTLIIAGMDIRPPAGFEDQVPLIAATSVLASLNNIGPGLAAVGPAGNFAFMPEAAKLLLSFFMILGRLEFYAVVILFVPRFWRS